MLKQNQVARGLAVLVIFALLAFGALNSGVDRSRRPLLSEENTVIVESVHRTIRNAPVFHSMPTPEIRAVNYLDAEFRNNSEFNHRLLRIGTREYDEADLTPHDERRQIPEFFDTMQPKLSAGEYVKKYHPMRQKVMAVSD